jgi:FKBP-type peptidyl-prolyl cis-trans isomerase (trigger factor)
MLDGWRDDADKSLRTRLVINALVVERKLDVLDEELEKEFETLAANADLSLEDVK